MPACAEHPRGAACLLGMTLVSFSINLHPHPTVASYIQAALPTTLTVLGSDLQVCLCFKLMSLTGNNFLPSALRSVSTAD